MDSTGSLENQKIENSDSQKLKNNLNNNSEVVEVNVAKYFQSGLTQVNISKSILLIL